MRTLETKSRRNRALAKAAWGPLSRAARQALNELTAQYSLSVALGDIQRIGGRWYVTHAGLLRLALRERCSGIRVFRIPDLCDPVGSRWAFKAIVYKSRHSKGFVGFGDADPSNVSPLVRGAEMRIAETRAVNRALRKAYGIGLCSVEELGYLTSRPEPPSGNGNGRDHLNHNNSGNGHPRLRDRLCLLIRKHELDPKLVKRYAADFCGTQELRRASRDRVESFITHLADSASKDRDGLVCKLNSYAQAQEVQP
jgi:hypothetical protein